MMVHRQVQEFLGDNICDPQLTHWFNEIDPLRTHHR